MILIKPRIKTIILNHASRAYPDECIGIITAKGEEQFVYPFVNIQKSMQQQEPQKYPWSSHYAYAVDRKAFDSTLNRALKGGEALMAFYHSHPDHNAFFSDIDREAQTVFGEPEFPQATHIVISVRLGIPGDMRGYKWNWDTKDFDEILIK